MRIKKYKRNGSNKLKFSQLDEISKKVDTIIFDLGLSSIQLNNYEEVFLKSKDKLDMTMGLTDISAEDVINNLVKTLKLIN